MFNPEKVKLGIAPIGWTNDDMPDLGAEKILFEQCISEMALAGFKGCEAGNKFPSDPAVLKHKLKSSGLQICNAWFSSYLIGRPYEETIASFIRHRDKLNYLGAKIIGASEQGNSIQGKIDVPILENKPIYTEEEWKIVTKGLTKWENLSAKRGCFSMYITIWEPHSNRRRDRSNHGNDGSEFGISFIRLRTPEFCGY